MRTYPRLQHKTLKAIYVYMYISRIQCVSFEHLLKYSSVVLIATAVLVTSVFCSNSAEIDRT